MNLLASLSGRRTGYLPQPAPWLESVDLIGERRSFRGQRLRYHPVVPVGNVRLSLRLRPGAAQQLMVEHRGPGQLIATDILSVVGGKVEWPVQLLRGWNRLRCSAPGESRKVFVLDLTHKTSWREWLETLLYALAFALLIRTFLLQVVVLPLDSRMEGLQAGDRILVNRVHPVLAGPEPGDLTILEHGAAPRGHSPGEQAVLEHVSGPAARFTIKRIAAVGGQTIETAGASLRVDGVTLGPPFDSLGRSGIATADLPGPVPPTRVPHGQSFLVSSHQDAAGHTVCWWWFLADRSILGRGWAVFWPWERRCWVQ
ncbi:MAG: hypothetical protein HY814_00425 [Candidatus Riflebacteria bacterium]|nr:hypothetical protein [Candidatus Riflebacteria bacterium]